MFEGVIFDCDGMINLEKRFSVRLSEKGITPDTTAHFFKKQFQDCLVGKSDLKEELKKCVPSWGWGKSVEELLQFWFDDEANRIDERFDPIMRNIRSRSIKTYLSTNNEIHRTRYLLSRIPKNWFDDVFSSARIGAKKPDTDFFQYIVNTTHTSRHSVLFWDDDIDNVESARAFGFSAELYTDFYSFKSRMHELL